MSYLQGFEKYFGGEDEEILKIVLSPMIVRQL